MSGPFGTEAEAREAVRYIYNIEPVAGAWLEPSLALLLDTCADAGVAVGEYDSRILHWLASWEPSTVAVIAGLISRAHIGLVDRLRIEVAQLEAILAEVPAEFGGPGTAQPGGGWISGPSQ